MTTWLVRIGRGSLHLWQRVVPPWKNRRLPYFLILLLLVVGVVSAIPRIPSVNQGLDSIREDGKLVLLTRQSPTTYYQGTVGPTGFEYELGRAIGKSLGVEVEFRLFDTDRDVLDALAAKKGQAAIGLALTPLRREAFATSVGYEKISQIVICRRDVKRAKKLADLGGLSVVVNRGSAGEEVLAAMDTEALDVSYSSRTPEELMQDVANKLIDCTVANSLLFRITNPYYPELVERFTLVDGQEIGWLLAPGSEDLTEYLRTWFAGARKSGRFTSIERRFYGFLPPFDYVDIRAFQRAIKTVLPDYEKAFRRAARKTGLPWEFLAAMGYQESHWDPDAKSHTGVRGIMMLTEATALEMGVEDRLNAAESIDAGARYIAELIERLPEEIPASEKKWFALAAYNLGMGHLYGARTIAARMGLDPNAWTDLRRALPYLQRKAFYSTLKTGRARGGEAVRFVQQVRTYQHILEGQ